MNPTTHLTALLLALLGAAALSGCGAWRMPRQGDLLAATVTDLQPLHDRDHFVFRWQRLIDGKQVGRGTHVEHVTALAADDEFEISITEDGRPSERIRVHLRPDGMAVLEEEDVAQGIKLVYDPPLVQLRAPVLVGPQEASATAEVVRVDDDSVVDRVQVQQHIEVRYAGVVTSEFGEFSGGIALRTWRTMQTGGGPVELQTAVLLLPGIGEMRSEGGSSGGLGTAAPATPDGAIPRIVTRRELACAIVGGRAIGDCTRVRADGLP